MDMLFYNVHELIAVEDSVNEWRCPWCWSLNWAFLHWSDNNSGTVHGIRCVLLHGYATLYVHLLLLLIYCTRYWSIDVRIWLYSAMKVLEMSAFDAGSSLNPVCTELREPVVLSMAPKKNCLAIRLILLSCGIVLPMLYHIKGRCKTLLFLNWTWTGNLTAPF